MKEFWIIFSIFSSCVLSWIHFINCRSLVGIGKLKHGPHTAQFDKSQPKMVKSVLGSHAIYFKPHLKGLEEMFASSSERNEQMIENVSMKDELNVLDEIISVTTTENGVEANKFTTNDDEIVTVSPMIIQSTEEIAVDGVLTDGSSDTSDGVSSNQILIDGSIPKEINTNIFAAKDIELTTKSSIEFQSPKGRAIDDEIVNDISTVSNDLSSNEILTFATTPKNVFLNQVSSEGDEILTESPLLKGRNQLLLEIVKLEEELAQEQRDAINDANDEQQLKSSIEESVNEFKEKESSTRSFLADVDDISLDEITTVAITSKDADFDEVTSDDELNLIDVPRDVLDTNTEPTLLSIDDFEIGFGKDPEQRIDNLLSIFEGIKSRDSGNENDLNQNSEIKRVIENDSEMNSLPKIDSDEITLVEMIANIASLINQPEEKASEEQNVLITTEKSEIPVEEEESDIHINDLDNNRLPRIDGIFLPIEPKDFKGKTGFGSLGVGSSAISTEKSNLQMNIFIEDKGRSLGNNNEIDINSKNGATETIQPIETDEKQPIQPLGPGGLQPIKPLGPGGIRPIMPLGPEGMQQIEPLGPGGLSQTPSLGPGGIQPIQPLGPEGKVQIQPLGPGGIQPIQPLGPDGIQPTKPLGPEGIKQIKPLGPGGLQPIKPLGPGGILPIKPLGPEGIQQVEPLGPEGLPQIQSLRPVAIQPIQPLGPEGKEQIQPLGPGGLQPINPLGTEGIQPIKPLGPGGIRSIKPLGLEGIQQVKPLGPGGLPQVQSLGSGGIQTIQPLGPEGKEQIKPLGPGGLQPIQNLGPGGTQPLQLTNFVGGSMSGGNGGSFGEIDVKNGEFVPREEETDNDGGSFGEDNSSGEDGGSFGDIDTKNGGFMPKEKETDNDGGSFGGDNSSGGNGGSFGEIDTKNGGFIPNEKENHNDGGSFDGDSSSGGDGGSFGEIDNKNGGFVPKEKENNNDGGSFGGDSSSGGNGGSFGQIDTKNGGFVPIEKDNGSDGGSFEGHSSSGADGGSFGEKDTKNGGFVPKEKDSNNDGGSFGGDDSLDGDGGSFGEIDSKNGGFVPTEQQTKDDGGSFGGPGSFLGGLTSFSGSSHADDKNVENKKEVNPILGKDVPLLGISSDAAIPLDLSENTVSDELEIPTLDTTTAIPIIVLDVTENAPLDDLDDTISGLTTAIPTESPKAIKDTTSKEFEILDSVMDESNGMSMMPGWKPIKNSGTISREGEGTFTEGGGGKWKYTLCILWWKNDSKTQPEKCKMVQVA